MRQTIETLIENGSVFTGNRDNPHIDPGAIAVDGGRIVAVGPESEIKDAFSGRETIDARGGTVHPGLIEAHLHLLSVPFHSLSVDPDGRSKKQISYSSVKTETDDASVGAFGAAAAAACLKKGITLFTEPGTLFETDAFSASIEAVGSRALVSAPYGWDDVSIFYDLMPGTMSEKLMQRAPASSKRVADQCRKELSRNKDRDSLVQGFVCLYGLGSSSDELIQECLSIARDNDTVYSQHDGYLPEYVEAEERYFGLTGISRLAKLDGLGPASSLTHLNVVRDSDADLIQSTKTNVLWSPINALNRGLHRNHKCHHPAWYRSGLTVAVVSDSVLEYPLGSAGLASLFLSGSVGEQLQNHDPFYMQSIDAARSLGLDRDLGSLEVGKKADIVIRKPKDLTETTLSTMGGTLATSSSMIEVDIVLVDGKTILKDGHLTRVDEDEILANGRHQRDLIIDRVSG